MLLTDLCEFFERYDIYNCIFRPFGISDLPKIHPLNKKDKRAQWQKKTLLHAISKQLQLYVLFPKLAQHDHTEHFVNSCFTYLLITNSLSFDSERSNQM